MKIFLNQKKLLFSSIFILIANTTEKPTCSSMVDIPNASSNCLTVDEGATCQVRCDQGFEGGSVSFTCVNGQWTGSLTCQKKLCEDKLYNKKIENTNGCYCGPETSTVCAENKYCWEHGSPSVHYCTDKPYCRHNVWLTPDKECYCGPETSNVCLANNYCRYYNSMHNCNNIPYCKTNKVKKLRTSCICAKEPCNKKFCWQDGSCNDKQQCIPSNSTAIALKGGCYCGPEKILCAKKKVLLGRWIVWNQI